MLNIMLVEQQSVIALYSFHAARTKQNRIPCKIALFAIINKLMVDHLKRFYTNQQKSKNIGQH